jgi:hypothetical protein
MRVYAVSQTSDPVFQNQIAHILSHMEDPPEDDSTPEPCQGSQDDLGIDTMEYDDEFEEIQEVLSSGVVRQGRLNPCCVLHHAQHTSKFTPPS